MARYNKKARDESRTTNHEGATAWKLDAFENKGSIVEEIKKVKV